MGLGSCGRAKVWARDAEGGFSAKNWRMSMHEPAPLSEAVWALVDVSRVRASVLVPAGRIGGRFQEPYICGINL